MDSREFYFKLCDILNSINLKYDEYDKKYGVVSNNLFWIIYALYDNKPHTQLYLSEHCSLPKTTVNTIIKDLEKKDYINMICGKDKREKYILLTQKGKDYASNLLGDLFLKEDNIFNQNKKGIRKIN